MTPTTESYDLGIPAALTSAGICAGVGCAIFFSPPLGINPTAACIYCGATGLCAGLICAELERQGKEERNKRTLEMLKIYSSSLKSR